MLLSSSCRLAVVGHMATAWTAWVRTTHSRGSCTLYLPGWPPFRLLRDRINLCVCSIKVYVSRPTVKTNLVSVSMSSVYVTGTSGSINQVEARGSREGDSLTQICSH